MAELVFVHGVANRESDEGFVQKVGQRSQLFQSVTFEGTPVSVRNPYWGGSGADPQWKLACVPKPGQDYQALGLADAPQNRGFRDYANVSALETARRDFPALVGALSSIALNEEGQSDRERFWAGAAAYAVLQPAPAWLGTITTDEEFYAKLETEATAFASFQDDQQALGIFDSLKKTAERWKGNLQDGIEYPLVKLGRENLTPSIAIFLGDVFRYLKDGAGREPIRAIVINDLLAAARKARADKQPLVAVGHSMGGIILYDLLSDPQVVDTLSQALGAPFKLDLFLTVGSQVALFEELKLFGSSKPQYSGKGGLVPLPPSIAHWWNCFDKSDLLSFLAAPVFADVVDFRVDTAAGVKDAHGAYFGNLLFYTRLNARLKEAAILS